MPVQLRMLGSQEKIDKFAVSLFLLYRRSRVLLWVATAYMAWLLLDEVNGAL